MPIIIDYIIIIFPTHVFSSSITQLFSIAHYYAIGNRWVVEDDVFSNIRNFRAWIKYYM
jgi:hypothetical protein